MKNIIISNSPGCAAEIFYCSFTWKKFWGSEIRGWNIPRLYFYQNYYPFRVPILSLLWASSPTFKVDMCVIIILPLRKYVFSDLHNRQIDGKNPKKCWECLFWLSFLVTRLHCLYRFLENQKIPAPNLIVQAFERFIGT